MAAKFEINMANNNEFHVLLKGGNGEVIASGETYATMAGAQAGIVAVQTAAANANRVDKTKAAASNDYSGTFELFNDAAGEIRFRLVSSSGETILQSEGYASMGGALNGIDSVQTNAVIFGQFQYKTASNGQYFFVLLAGNNEPIGHSELYKTLGGRAVGQYAVERSAPTAAIVDLTVAQPPTPKPAEFRITQDAESGQFTFLLVDPKGRLLLTADNLYVSKQGAQNGIASVQTNAVDLTRYSNASLDDGTLYFQLKAGNNVVLGDSPFTKSQADRAALVQAVKTNAPTAIVVDLTMSQVRQARFEIYRDAPTGLQYFWRLKSSNSFEILASPAASASQADAQAQISVVKARAVSAANFVNSTSGAAFKFELRDAAGATIGVSQSYAAQASSDAGLSSVVNNAPNAIVIIIPWVMPATLEPTLAPTPAPTPAIGSPCSAFVLCDQCANAASASDGPCKWCSTAVQAGSCVTASAACSAGTAVTAAASCPTEAPTPAPTVAPTPAPTVDPTQTFATVPVTAAPAITESTVTAGCGALVVPTLVAVALAQLQVL